MWEVALLQRWASLCEVHMSLSPQMLPSSLFRGEDVAVGIKALPIVGVDSSPQPPGPLVSHDSAATLREPCIYAHYANCSAGSFF